MNLEKQARIDKAIDDLDGVFPGAGRFNYLFCGTHGFVARNWLQFNGFMRICTRAEFEARKAERQGKPNWSKASAWAHWLAQDSAGSWWWYPNCVDAPMLGGERFINQSTDRVIFAGSGAIIGSWRNTLEQRPNHIGESDEKVSTRAEIEQAAQACERVLSEFFPEANLGSADWYDYDKQEATKLPPVGAEFELWPHFHVCEVVAHHDGGVVIYDKKALKYVQIKLGDFRCWPLDFKPSQEAPSPSPELSFHLSNAFNELQASARLLPEDDPRRAQLVALAGGVSAVKEVA